MGVYTNPVDTSTFATKTGTETLTNKSLTAPVVSTIVNTGTLTLPTTTDTLVGRATTDTLTNKTLTSPVISSISNTGILTLPTVTDTLVGRATTDTLTNKTLTNPVIASITNSGTLTLPTSTDTLVGRATTDTLLNKTMAKSVTQSSHGFTVGTLLYYTGSAYAKSKADAMATAEVDGIVIAVPDANTFVLGMSGAYLTVLSGLTAGSLYFLSDATAGTYTATAPTTATSIRKPLFHADSTTTAYFYNYLGVSVAVASGTGSGGGVNGPTFQLSQGVSDIGFGQRSIYIMHRTVTAQSVTKMECFVTNIQSGSTVQMGIYNASGTLLASGTYTTGSTGNQIFNVTLSSSVSLAANTTYYYAIVNQTSEFNTKILAANSFNSTVLTSYVDGAASLPSTMAAVGSRSSLPQTIYLLAY